MRPRSPDPCRPADSQTSRVGGPARGTRAGSEGVAEVVRTALGADTTAPGAGLAPLLPPSAPRTSSPLPPNVPRLRRETGGETGNVSSPGVRRFGRATPGGGGRRRRSRSEGVAEARRTASADTAAPQGRSRASALSLAPCGRIGGVPVNRFAMAGWAAFALSGVFYLVSSIRAGDIWSAMGSIVWLIGIGFFLASYRPT